MVTPTERKQVKYGENPKFLCKYYGKHDDTKPTDEVANGSWFVEMDTGDIYLYDEAGEAWIKFCSLGGSGS